MPPFPLSKMACVEEQINTEDLLCMLANDKTLSRRLQGKANEKAISHQVLSTLSVLQASLWKKKNQTSGWDKKNTTVRTQLEN